MSTNMFNPSDKRFYPARWKTCRGKQLFQVIDERSLDGNEELLSVSHITGITPRKQKNVTMFQSESLVGYKICRIGDIAANTMWTWQGAIGVSSYFGVISPAYNVYRQIENVYNGRYLDLLLRERKLIDVYHSLSTGIRPSRLRLYPEVFLTIDFPVPPREEQDQIVRFLDWKVSEINRLINIKKRRLAIVQELIDKQFRILASKAIQKTKLKYIVNLCQDFIEIIPSDYYCKTGMYNRGRGIFRREAILGEDMGDSSFQEIHSGCVMISGQFAWEAATYVTAKEDESGVVSHRYYLLKSTTEIPPEYIWAFLISDYGQMLMKSCSHGAAGRNRPLNIKELLNEYIPIPDSSCKSEVQSLVNTVQQMMALRKATLQEEQILSEMRSRLISDVVTGKIDVRGIEIPEYEYTAEEADTDSEAEAEEFDEEVSDE